MAEPETTSGGAARVEPDVPSRDQVMSWIGAKLDDMGGAGVGRIEGYFVDARSAAPSWLLIRVGWLGHRTAVPVEFAAAGVGHVWLPFSRKTIRSAPEIDPGAALSREAERALAAHFGIPVDRGRLEKLLERPAGEPTSVPRFRH